MLALATVFGTATLAPKIEARAEGATTYNRSDLSVGQRLYPGDTIDCVYSATVAIGHSGIMHYYLNGEGRFIAFLEIKDYSFKKESLEQTYTLEKDTSLTFTADVDFAKFESVAVDGQIVSADNYTAKSGSTIVELKKDFINRLSAGEHTITVNWVDGSASTKIKVESQSTVTPEVPTTTEAPTTTESGTPADSNPSTGDGAISLIFALLIMSGMVMIIFFSRRINGVQ